MIKKTIDLSNAVALKEDTIPMIVQTATQFESKIRFVNGNVRANGKSLLGLMSFVASVTDSFELEMEGTDEAEAAEKMAEIICR